MSPASLKSEVNPLIGEQMYALASELFPICRSITGNGVRETLSVLKKIIPLEIKEVPSGTKVFDWVVPKEWNIKDAYIKNSQGEKIVDFSKSNLHVVNYSCPVHKTINLEELKSHLHYLPEHPEWIPYRTSYYHEDWGFCLSFNQFQQLKEDTYEVYIDSALEQGSLTYGEYYLQGTTDDEILISVHVCHPSLANDNLSGISVATFLANELRQMEHRYSYRFLFIPGTIGAITWLALNELKVSKIKHGIVISLVGDSGNFTYKKSRRGDTEIDKIAAYVLSSKNVNNAVIEFSPYGYDERQYCSPGFNLPVGCLSRTPYGKYVQYHTSADDLSFIQPKCLEESLQTVLQIAATLEANLTLISLNMKCEPQLGRRGMYDLKGGKNDSKDFQLALLWTLNLSDGNHSLLDISIRSGIDFSIIKDAGEKLLISGLVEPVSK